MDWIISITSCLMLWMMGNKSVWGPVLGIINQGLWIFYVSWTGQWGLMLGVILYTAVHTRNLVKWLRTKKRTAETVTYSLVAYMNPTVETEIRWY